MVSGRQKDACAPGRRHRRRVAPRGHGGRRGQVNDQSAAEVDGGKELIEQALALADGC
jgi:hypothetical protein